MTTTKQYDYLNRLTSISSLNSQLSPVNSFTYTYNNANQRVRVAMPDIDGPRDMGPRAYWNFVHGHEAKETPAVYQANKNAVINSIRARLDADLSYILISPDAP